MFTAATDNPGTSTLVRDNSTLGLGPIVVATDGTESSDAALRAAAMLARETHAGVVALTVLESLPLVTADYGVIVPPIDEAPARRQSLMKRVREQVERLALDADDWTIEAREGDPAATIARAAGELDARLIVIGIGHHDLLDRLFGGETALHTLRLARVPVLAVPPDFNALPKRALIATDFTVASVSAARKARLLFDTIDHAYVVHVAPLPGLQPDVFGVWMSAFAEGVGPAFERVKAEMGLPLAVTIETATITGKPSREILKFARENKVDLIVTGSRGAGLVDRILVGSTATGILRAAECAVLAVPSRSNEQRMVWPTSGDRQTLQPERWAEELEAFTRRNAGRLAALEVDDPDMGAQAQEHDYPLLGASWDHHDQRVELMLGDFEGVRRHLTRGISGVTAIDLLRDEKGRDWILRIAHDPGQTLLTLKR